MRTDVGDIFKLASDFEKLAKKKKKKGKWKDLPSGWDSKSRHSYYESMGKSVNKCIKKMKDKIDDPGAFCASLKDRESKNWRKKAEELPKSQLAKKTVKDWLFNIMNLSDGTLNLVAGMRPDYKMSVRTCDEKCNVILCGNFFNNSKIIDSNKYQTKIAELLQNELRSKFPGTKVNVVVVANAKHISAFGVR